MSDESDYDEDSEVDPSTESTNQQRDYEPEDKSLTKEMVADNLSLLCKTGNALAHAYVKLDIHDQELTDISILNCYVHLRYVDVTGNNLKDISTLNSLTHLLTLKADKNRLKSAKMEELPYLQIASFANNKITDTEGISHPLLESLNLQDNEIVEVTGLDPRGLGGLHTLELRRNKLVSTRGLSLPSLKSLYLAENQIREIVEINRLPHLTFLHLRDNKIETLDGFSDGMKNLQYLNMKKNSVGELSEISKLKCLPKLRVLVLSDNPVCLESGYRIEVLISLRRLERLDKEIFTEDERQEAEEIYEQKRREENDENEAAEVIELEEEED